MKPEEQRQALASALPKTLGLSSSGCWMWRDSTEHWHACHENDPLQDLNAMREAVAHLISGDIGQDLQARSRVKIFTRELLKLTSGRYAPDWPECDSYGSFCVLHLMLQLTSERVAEAVLRTTNLWTDTTP